MRGEDALSALAGIQADLAGAFGGTIGAELAVARTIGGAIGGAKPGLADALESRSRRSLLGPGGDDGGRVHLHLDVELPKLLAGRLLAIAAIAAVTA